MPSRREHIALCKSWLGEGFEEVHALLDAPARYLGPSHRRFFHTPEEAFALGLLMTGTTQGGIAGVTHVIHDEIDGAFRRFLRGLGDRR